MKRRFIRIVLGVLAICSTLLVLAGPSAAKMETVPVEGVSYNTGSSMAENLRPLAGKTVSVTLNSGTSLSGIVGEVGEHMLHLEKLVGKEYFDALIRIEDISAIETRFREPKR